MLYRWNKVIADEDVVKTFTSSGICGGVMVSMTIGDCVCKTMFDDKPIQAIRVVAYVLVEVTGEDDGVTFC